VEKRLKTRKHLSLINPKKGTCEQLLGLLHDIKRVGSSSRRRKGPEKGPADAGEIGESRETFRKEGERKRKALKEKLRAGQPCEDYGWSGTGLESKVG